MRASHKKSGMQVDLLNCNVRQGLIVFTLPFLVSTVLENLYSTVDSVVVGQFVGNVGLTAVNNISSVCNIVHNIGIGTSYGAAILIAQYVGRKDEEGIRKAIGSALTISCIMAVVMTILICILANPLLTLLNIPTEAYTEAYNYLLVRAWGFLIAFLYNSLAAFLRGLGDSRRPMYFTLVASVTNVALDLLFVAVFRWRAAGAAIATVIAEAIALVWAFCYMKKHCPGLLTLEPRRYIPHPPTVKLLLKIGVPSAMQYAFIDLSFVFVNRMVNGYGLIAAAAVAVGNKTVNLGQIGSGSLATAASTMAGQNLGAGKPERANQTIKSAVLLSVIFSLTIFLLIQLFPGQIVRLFNSDADALTETIRCLRLLSLMLIPSAFFFEYVAIANAAGNTAFAMFCYILDGVFVRILLSLLLSEVFGLGLLGVYLGMGLAPTVSAIISAAYFYSGVWKKRHLLPQTDQPAEKEEQAAQQR